MKPFMNADFLLSTETARALYRNVAANTPIIDYHCHVSPKEIYEDKHFEDLFDIWLSGDHYKWRIMRSNGVEERYITGDAPRREKFQKFAEALPKAIGNPMYHWCHLELKNYFGYEGILSGDTAEEVWQLAGEVLSRPDMGARGIIEKSNVQFVGTTDDPLDSLEWHQKLMADDTFTATVAPTFRPDKALNMDKPGFADYIAALGELTGIQIRTVADVKAALSLRMDHFAACGCKASDHGLDYMVYSPLPEADVDAILARALAGEAVTLTEAEGYKTALLCFCGAEYARRGWVMQLHYNCLRNPNSRMLAALGPDTGFDCIGPAPSRDALAGLLDTLYSTDSLPKTIIYSLDAGDNAFIDTLIGAFQGTEAAGKLQHGSAWWFNDNKTGMQEQLTSLANLSLLGNFVGMLTDSRSFLSYTRHEYFRRILCDLIGRWVENGEYPADMGALSTIVRDICCDNAIRYFGLE